MQYHIILKFIFVNKFINLSYAIFMLENCLFFCGITEIRRSFDG